LFKRRDLMVERKVALMGRDVVTCETITQLFNGAVRRGGQNRFQWWRTGPDTTESLTYTQVGFKVKDLCGALLEMGIQKRDRIAIMAPNCPQWLWADMAILNAGGVTVTIYPTSSEHELSYIINDSGCRAIFVKDADILQRVLNSVGNLPTLEKIIVMDSDYEGNHPLLISIDEMLKKGAVYLAQNPTTYEERWHSVQPWDWATIVYTSGTTGQSKGVLHTHRSIMASIYRDDYNTAISDYSFDENDINLCFLPLSHTYERQMGEMMIMMYGGTIAYAQKASTVIQDIQVFQPTYFMSVPRIYERIYMTLRDMACKTEQGRQMFENAMEIGMQVIDARTKENDPHLRKQLLLLNHAQISTIHSFCNEVVRNYFHLIDIDPGYRIADQTEAGLIKMEVLEELIEKQYEQSDPGFLNLVESFSSSRDDTPFKDLVLQVYDFIQSQPEPLHWLREKIDMFAGDADQINQSILLSRFHTGSR
jgi:long-subunit acyl-CoA synthetase (AMP-forming)